MRVPRPIAWRQGNSGHGQSALVDPYFLTGGGSTDGTLEFSQEGVFWPSVRPLQPVQRGECLGDVRGVDGSVLETISSPRVGRVVFLRAVPPVVPGEPAALVAEEFTGRNWKWRRQNGTSMQFDG